jgi:hypothetical protein
MQLRRQQTGNTEHNKQWLERDDSKSGTTITCRYGVGIWNPVTMNFLQPYPWERASQDATNVIKQPEMRGSFFKIFHACAHTKEFPTVVQHSTWISVGRTLPGPRTSACEHVWRQLHAVVRVGDTHAHCRKVTSDVISAPYLSNGDRKILRWYNWYIILPVLYGCETSSLWSVYENRVQRRTSGPNEEEVAGGRRKLHNEELHNLYSSPDIIRETKRKKMGGICSTHE